MRFPERFRNEGLLIIRIGLGIMFMYHGFPKITGGPEKWAGLGMAMGSLGIHFFPVFWGFMAAVSEFFGGILLIAGLFTQPTCAFMAFTMAIASLTQLTKGQGLDGASHAMELGIVFIGLIFVGPGKYSLDKKFNLV